MLSVGRIVGTFLALMVIGYLGIVAFVPAPAATAYRDDGDVDPGQNAAMRLSAQAQALVAPKPLVTLQ